MFPSEVVQVSCSVLGEKSGALGGVALAVEEYSLITSKTTVRVWR
jgi:hypothetical protein